MTWVITLTGVVLGAASGWLVSTALTTGQIATASVVITPLPGNPYAKGSNASLVNLETEAQIARSDRVLSVVARSGVGPTDIETLRSRLTVSAVEGAEVIRIAYRSPDAAQSATVAQQVASTTLRVREQQAEATRDTQVRMISDLVDATVADLLAAEQGERLLILSRRLASLQDQLQITTDQDFDPGTVLSVVMTTDAHATLRLGLIAAGAAVGSIVGYGVARRVRRRFVNAPTLW